MQIQVLMIHLHSINTHTHTIMIHVQTIHKQTPTKIITYIHRQWWIYKENSDNDTQKMTATAVYGRAESWDLSKRSCLPLKVVFHRRASSIECRLPVKAIFNRGRLQSRSSSIKVVFNQRSSSIKGRFPSEVVFQWRLSSIGGCLPLKVVFPWRSSSIKGCLPFKVVFHQNYHQAAPDVL